MMKKYNLSKLTYLIIALMLAQYSANGQQIINGSFEQNSAGTCHWNLTNSVFNNYMPFCFAYGINDELDIQRAGCNQAPAPLQGRYFVSLYSNGTADALSVFTDTPLTAGVSYTIGIYVSAFVGVLTTDSLLIGISTDSSQFGTRLFAVLPPVGPWGYFSHTFVAPFSTRYITLENQNHLEGWNFIDQVMLQNTVGTTENHGTDPEINIYPNPAFDHFTITVSGAPQLTAINLLTLTGQKVSSKSSIRENSFAFDVSHLAAGIYTAEVICGDALKRVMFIKQE